MGTTDTIFILNGILTNLLNENKKLYVRYFVDFSKAFDFLVRDVLSYGTN